MRLGIHVALVTAAGYPQQPSKFEARIAGLLRAFALALEAGAPASLLSFFHVMGGECNYLLEPYADVPPDGLSPRVHLRELPDEVWKDGRGVRWDHEDVARLLDAAEASLTDCAARLGLDVLVIRKERAVGIISNPHPNQAASAAASTPGAALPGAYAGRLTYETLEEVAITVQHHLQSDVRVTIPFCSFNGGNDVFIDVGSKSLGIRALQSRLGATPATTVHAGDRFTRTGNDLRAREVANTIWVAGPEETEYLLTRLIENVRAQRNGAAAAAAGGGAGTSGAVGLAAPLPSSAGSAEESVTQKSEPAPAHEPSSPVGLVVRAPVAEPVDGVPSQSPPSAGSAAGEGARDRHREAADLAIDAAAAQRVFMAGSGTGAGSGPSSVSSSGGRFTGGLLQQAEGGSFFVRTPVLTGASAVGLGPGPGIGTGIGLMLDSDELALGGGGGAAAPVSSSAVPAQAQSQSAAATAWSSFKAGSGLAGTGLSIGTAHPPLPLHTHTGAGAGTGVGTGTGTPRTASVGGVSAGSPHLIPGVYGMTAERAQLQAVNLAKDAMRSQWESAGGRVAAEVRPGPPGGASFVVSRALSAASSTGSASSGSAGGAGIGISRAASHASSVGSSSSSPGQSSSPATVVLAPADAAASNAGGK